MGGVMSRCGSTVLLLPSPSGIWRVGSQELTLPGFVQDVGSAIHPLALGSPFFRELPLAEYGLEWIHPDVPLAHPFDDGSEAVLERSLDATVAGLGADGDAYRALMGPTVRDWQALLHEFLGPLRVPRHPFVMARFGLRAIQPAAGLARRSFRGEAARALFAGLAGHSIQPLERPATAAFGLMLGLLAHAVGWPLPRGGAGSITAALVAHLESLGGEVVTDHPVASLDELPPARATLLDVTPRQALRIAGGRLPAGYRRGLERYRYGPGVFKVDWALGGPIPWTAEACRRAGTVHVGGTLDEIAASERDAWRGRHSERPFVLVTQQSLFDGSRAPEGKHTGWAYCHVPHGSTVDMTEPIEAQVERFAPGFRDSVLARHTMNTSALERFDPNLIGGDINGGVQDLEQLFTRPVPHWNPYATPVPGLFLCSSSTPPGGGVHGMGGSFAARAALRHLRGA
jgi:phytoene dehydrogenase-like protein